MARLLYSTYTEAVGGVNFRGEPLPSADEFFTDETKKKQADAWRHVVCTHYPYTVIKDRCEGMTDLPWYVAMEAMKDGWGVRRSSWDGDMVMRAHKVNDDYHYYFTTTEFPGLHTWVITSFLPDGCDWEIVGPQLDVDLPAGKQACSNELVSDAHEEE